MPEEGFGWRLEEDGKVGGKAGDEAGGKEGGFGYLVPPLPAITRERSELFNSLVSAFVEKNADGVLDKPTARIQLMGLLKGLCEHRRLLLEKKTADALVEAALSNVSGFGAFDFFLSDDSIEEISLSGLGQNVFVYKRGVGWLKTNCVVTSLDFAVNAVNKMARPLGRRLTFQTPRLNAQLPDGSRLHASIAPVCLNAIEVCIRKFREQPFSLPELVANNTISGDAAAFLWLALATDSSVLIAGNTGSGKTTLLNTLFSFVQQSDRIVITEDTPELTLLHPHCVRIVANEDIGLPLSELVKDTLRMRPDRVVIGEVRSRDEVKALFDSLLAGQARGSYATFHARSANEAVTRLLALGAEQQDLQALDLIVVIKRTPFFDRKLGKFTEVRRVTELSALEQGELRQLFSFDKKTGVLMPTPYFKKTLLWDKIASTHSLSREQCFGEVGLRSEFISKHARATHAEFTVLAEKFVSKRV